MARKTTAQPSLPDAPDVAMSRAVAGADSMVTLYDRIGFLCRRMVQITESYFEEAARHLNLTMAQYDVMAALKDRDGVGQVAVGEVVGLDPANTAAIVRRLENAGLVTRLADPSDGRRRSVSLTPAGEELLGAAARISAEVSHRFLEPLAPDEQSSLLGILSGLADMEVNSVSQWRPETGSQASAALMRLYDGPCFLFRRVNQVILSKIRDRNRAENITARQYMFMIAVKDTPQVDQKTLSGMLGLDRSTIALIADNLEKRGLIDRAPDRRDRRRNLLSLTKTGFAIVERVGRNNSSIEVEMLGHLSLAERVALRAQLQRLLLAHNASVRTPIALPEGLIQRMSDAGTHD